MATDADYDERRRRQDQIIELADDITAFVERHGLPESGENPLMDLAMAVFDRGVEYERQRQERHRAELRRYTDAAVERRLRRG